MNGRTKRWMFSAGGVLAAASAVFAMVAARPGPVAVLTDGREIRVSAGSAPVRQVLWDAPHQVSAPQTNAADEYEPRLSADGASMVFVRRRPGTNADLFWCTWSPSGWSAPEPIATINTDADELGPELSWDGRTLYFYSDRDGGLGGYDLWCSTKSEQGWMTPINLGSAVNSEWNEYGPALTPSGDTIFFSSNRPRAGESVPTSDAWSATVRERRDRHDYDLYRSSASDNGFEAATPLGELNTSQDEGSPAVSPAGDFLYFASDRPGGAGGFDLYRARLAPTVQLHAEGVGAPINTASNELDPGLSADGFRLYFSSDRSPAQQSAQTESGEPVQRTADVPNYRLWFSTSREVYLDHAAIDAGATYAAVWDELWPWLALLSAAALLGWITYQVLRREAWRRRFGRLNLLAQCVLASLLIHAAVASLLAVWKVGTGILDLVNRPGGGGGGTQVVLASSGIASDVADQLLSSGFESQGLELPPLAAITADADSLHLESARAALEAPSVAPVEAPIAAMMASESTAETNISMAPSPVAPPAVHAAAPTVSAPSAVSEPAVEMVEVAGNATAAAPVAVQMASPQVSAAPPTSTRPDAASLPEVTASEARVTEQPTSVQTVLPGTHVQTPATLPGAAPAPATQEASAEPLGEVTPVPAADISHIASLGNAKFDVAPPTSVVPVGSGATPAVQVAPAESTAPSTVVEQPRATTALGPSKPAAVALPTASAGKTAAPEASSTISSRLDTPSAAAAGPAHALVAPRVEIAAQAPTRPIAGIDPLTAPVDVAASPSSDIATGGGSAVPRMPVDATSRVAVPGVASAGPARKVEPTLQPGTGNGATSGVLPEVAAPVTVGTRSAERVDVGVPRAAKASGRLGDSKPALAGDAPEAPGSTTNRFDVQSASRPSTGSAAGTIRVDAQGNIRLPATPPEPVETFAQRDPEVRGEILRQMGGSEETEAAVRRALAWMSRHQQRDGSWTGRHFDDQCGECSGAASFDADAAMTGMALLCYLGAGHTHQADGPYKETVTKALQWVVNRQRPDGDLRRGETMYGQTVCAVALCEAFSMTKDPELAAPARLAVEFVINVAGRPTPADRKRRSEDTSVIGWLVMTVESARRAGIAIPPHIFEGAGKWLDSVSDPAAPGRYGYTPGGTPTVAMTAEAMFVQQIIGLQRTDARMRQSAEFVLREPPAWREGAPTHSWYYATLALFEHQGEAWDRWNTALMPQLVEHQRRDGGADGSWDPQDEWSRMGGRIYQTAVCTLCLEAYYRYKPK